MPESQMQFTYLSSWSFICEKYDTYLIAFNIKATYILTFLAKKNWQQIFFHLKKLLLILSLLLFIIR